MAPITATTLINPPHATVDMEIPVKWSGGVKNHVIIVDVALRAFLFVTSLVAVIVIVTSKQTKMIPVSPLITIPVDVNWYMLHAYIYYVTAHCVGCLYSIITCATSILALKKIGRYSEKLQSQFVILDSVLLGIISSAAGAGAAIAYIGLKGNSYARWNKICNVFGSFCRHIGISVFMSLVSSVTLVLLVWLSVYALTKKITKR
ncbi:hypothetical protein QVD17_27022 [Tagetes erecta]|uniref:CASP-like protein n=1 Tax=Tagetes erecta TaxID=13708 RepID=A0AAD8NQV5_TARER|nr:hypothetical protein QVD17_27022 [Tagetes erecta]